MALSDALGASDDNTTLDPQSIVNNLMGAPAAGLSPDQNVDPQSVLNRLIRKGLQQREQAAQPPPDFSAYGKTQQELGPNAAPNGETPDFSQYGQAAEQTPPNPAYTGGGSGTAASPYTGNVAAAGSDADPGTLGALQTAGEAAAARALAASSNQSSLTASAAVGSPDSAAVATAWRRSVTWRRRSRARRRGRIRRCPPRSPGPAPCCGPTESAPGPCRGAR